MLKYYINKKHKWHVYIGVKKIRKYLNDGVTKHKRFYLYYWPKLNTKIPHYMMFMIDVNFIFSTTFCFRKFYGA